MANPIFKRELECALPARMINAIAMADVFVPTDDPDGPKHLERLRQLSLFAGIQPIEHLAPRVQLVASKHIDRVHAQVTDELDGQPGAKVAATIWRFLKEVTDSDYLELYEGSPVAEAAGLFLPMFEHAFEIEALHASAVKQSRKILAKLQTRGYYV